MAKELEAKFKITPNEMMDLIARIGKLKGAKMKYMRDELNEFFDTKKHKLESKDEILRLRTCVTESDRKYFVTHKGPKTGSRIKCREETEVEVHSDEETRALFRVLGFESTFSFKKQRTTYSYKNCLIEIDRILCLGDFCEIEGKSHKEIRAVMKELGFEKAKLITSGYGTLIRNMAKSQRKPLKGVQF